MDALYVKTMAESQQKFNKLKQLFSEQFGFEALLICIYSDPIVFERSHAFFMKYYPRRANCPANPLIAIKNNDIDDEDILSLESD